MDSAKCIWFTGLPCSGKTTLVQELKKHFPRCQILDGDEIRDTPLANFVGFTPEDRTNHILRMGHLAKMFVDQGITTLCSFVSPNKSTRDLVRQMFNEGEFFEVYLDTPLATCSKRDVKGMYAKAIAGIIPNFTGVGSTYEAPENPELKLDTSIADIQHCTKQLLEATKRIEELKTRWHWYFGRWNGCQHLGHEYIIQQSLDLYPHDNVMLAIRDVLPDLKNPWTAKEVKEMLDYRYADESRVHVIIVPDILSVEYGRGVGYEVNEIKVTKQIAGISGTECRRLIESNDPSWHNMVSPKIASFLEAKYR